MKQNFLNSILKQFNYYKFLGDKTLEQLENSQIFKSIGIEDNSIAIIVKHLHGNMLSRWTNFLTEDGEKNWRKREEEFVNNATKKSEVLDLWEKGWTVLFTTLENLHPTDLETEVFIRNMGHSVPEAIHRQLAHYAYHIGQIVFIGKSLQQSNWKSLSIPKGNSEVYNKEKFSKPKRTEHFTDDL
jgi:hypothetical protein